MSSSRQELHSRQLGCKQQEDGHPGTSIVARVLANKTPVDHPPILISVLARKWQRDIERNMKFTK